MKINIPMLVKRNTENQKYTNNCGNRKIKHYPKIFLTDLQKKASKFWGIYKYIISFIYYMYINTKFRSDLKI